MENNQIIKTKNISKNAKIYPNVLILGNCIIEEGVEIYSGSVIVNSRIGKNSKIKSSYIEDSEVCESVCVGPFACVRQNSKILKGAIVGNFVEVKNSVLCENVKAKHHSYIGDAEIGKNSNIGCGVIFCNYNGIIKNKIIIGENCFIGSNSNLIAPLNIAENTYICAGTTLTKNTRKYDFVISRNRETIKSDYAHKYFKK